MSIIRVATACVLLIGLGCGGGNPPESKDFEMGLKLEEQGLHEQSLPYFEKAIANNPKSTNALERRAFALLILGKKKEGKADIDAVIKMNPKNSEVLFIWGNELYFSQEAYGAEKAIKTLLESESYFKKAIALNPENMTYRKQLDAAIRIRRVREEQLERAKKQN